MYKHMYINFSPIDLVPDDLASSRFQIKMKEGRRKKENKDERRKNMEKRESGINNPINLTRYYLYPSSVI